MNRREACAGIALAALSAPAAVRAADALASDRFMLHSTHVGRDFMIEVTPPVGAGRPSRRLPAVYALDAGYHVAAPAAAALQSAGAMAPAFVVAIGYPPGQPNTRETDLLHRTHMDGGVRVGGGGVRGLHPGGAQARDRGALPGRPGPLDPARPLAGRPLRRQRAGRPAARLPRLPDGKPVDLGRFARAVPGPRRRAARTRAAGVRHRRRRGNAAHEDRRRRALGHPRRPGLDLRAAQPGVSGPDAHVLLPGLPRRRAAGRAAKPLTSQGREPARAGPSLKGAAAAVLRIVRWPIPSTRPCRPPFSR